MRGCHPAKLSVLDKLLIMLGYYREYRTMENIAFDYSVSKSTICESIKWVENNTTIEVVLVDATEIEIERPQKNSVNTTQVRKRNTH